MTSPTDYAEVLPLAVAEAASPAVAEVASLADIAGVVSWPLLGWRPRTKLLGAAPRESAHIKGALVMLPDSEMVAQVSIWSPSGIPPGRCSLIEPDLDIMESYGVLVGRTLVDVSDWSASVLLINLGSDIGGVALVLVCW